MPLFQTNQEPLSRKFRHGSAFPITKYRRYFRHLLFSAKGISGVPAWLRFPGYDIPFFSQIPSLSGEEGITTEIRGGGDSADNFRKRPAPPSASLICYAFVSDRPCLSLGNFDTAPLSRARNIAVLSDTFSFRRRAFREFRPGSAFPVTKHRRSPRHLLFSAKGISGVPARLRFSGYEISPFSDLLFSAKRA